MMLAAGAAQLDAVVLLALYGVRVPCSRQPGAARSQAHALDRSDHTFVGSKTAACVSGGQRGAIAARALLVPAKRLSSTRPPAHAPGRVPRG